MIIFFGPAGAGKSLQGQLLAARMNWRWLGIGQILRDYHDTAIDEAMRAGRLIESEKSTAIMADTIRKAGAVDQIILDGFPRDSYQADWLLSSQPEHGRAVGAMVVLDVPRDELLRRLELRGRADDTSAAIDNRLQDYQTVMLPIVDQLRDAGVPIVTIDGRGSVGEVHDRIYTALHEQGLTD